MKDSTSYKQTLADSGGLGGAGVFRNPTPLTQGFF